MKLNFNQFQLNQFQKSETAEKDCSNKDIAIIGIAGKFPLANHIDEFWNHIRNGLDCITDFPEERRKDAERFLSYTMKRNGKDIKFSVGSYLDEIDKFDYSFFKMSSKEASLMDPVQRIFLQTAWEAIEEAGYGGKRLIGTQTGVYVGLSEFGEYQYRQILKEVEPESAVIGFVGNLTPLTASRISYLLNLKGPSMIIDTTCSSSLVSVHLACQALRSGECEMALVGTAKLHLIPVETEQKLGIESSDGRTKSFDNRSDGTGAGEGVMAILLKPLNKALLDGDHIHAVIKGSAINQDGASAGITAPNAVAQEDVITQAWKDAGIDPTTISYIEAHGTGTELGDPIEIDGLERAFRKYTKQHQFCAIGSVKTNLGHLDQAAGLAGLLKAVMMLKHKEIPPIVHFREPNRKIRFETSPVYINDRLRPWETEYLPRRCGISSFGMSGTNCHVVLEEAPAEKTQMVSQQTERKQHVLTLSAKSEWALRELVKQYQAFLNRGPSYPLADLCYTANTGRGHYNYRLALIITSEEDLKAKLTSLVDCKWELGIQDEIYYGVFKPIGVQALSQQPGWITDQELRKITDQSKQLMANYQKNRDCTEAFMKQLCRLYISGADINWNDLYKGERRKKVSLPVYPFEKRRCWIDIPDGKQMNVQDSLFAQLLQTNSVPTEMKKELQELIERWQDQLKAYSFKQEQVVTKRIQLQGREQDSYTKTEVKLATIWGQTLGLDVINVFDQFYDLGGDSILAAKIINLLNEEGYTHLTVPDLFKYPTIADFAMFIEETNSEVVDLIPIEKIEIQEYYPVSSAQKRQMIVNQMEGSNSTTYNMPQALIIEGNLDVDRLEQAFQEIVKRHESLRTSFHWIDGEPVQKVHENFQFSVQRYEWSHPSLDILMKQFIQPFDLSTAPLLRIHLVTLAPQRYALLLDMHHIISDGTSMGILVKELVSLYQGIELAPLKFQYKDYSVWQKQLLETEQIKVQKQYWQKRFADGVDPLQLPTDYPRPSVQTYKGDKILFEVGQELKDALNQLAHETQSTLFHVLLTAYYTLLYKYTAQEDLVVGTPISGRRLPDLEPLIGKFINMLALRTRLSGKQSFMQLLEEVKKVVIEAMEHQDVPFDELVHHLNVYRDASRHPLFDTMFIMQNFEVPTVELEGLKWTSYPYQNEVSMLDLSFFAMETETGIQFKLEYNTDLFAAQSMEKLIEHYQYVLQQFVNDNTKCLNEIQLENENDLDVMIEVEEIEFQF